jgi:hypothetical protein
MVRHGRGLRLGLSQAIDWLRRERSTGGRDPRGAPLGRIVFGYDSIVRRAMKTPPTRGVSR